MHLDLLRKASTWTYVCDITSFIIAFIDLFQKVVDASFAMSHIGHMRKDANPLQVNRQQIARYLDVYGYGSLVDAKHKVEQELHRDVADTSQWINWETCGLRMTDLESDEAKAIMTLIHSLEDDFLLLRPLVVRQWREQMGFSQLEAADYVGVVRATWSRWEQLGIDDGAGIAAYALAASVTSLNPELLKKRTQIVERLQSLYNKANHFHKTSYITKLDLNDKVCKEVIQITRHGEQGEEARLGLGSFGLYHLLRQAWETKPCKSCETKNPDNANFCSHCGFAFDTTKEGF